MIDHQHGRYAVEAACKNEIEPTPQIEGTSNQYGGDKSGKGADKCICVPHDDHHEKTKKEPIISLWQPRYANHNQRCDKNGNKITAADA